jgi:hypothetical protein
MAVVKVRCLVTVVAVLAAASSSFANPEYGRKTGKECRYCHPPNNYNLTEAGKFYQEHHKSLKGYVPSGNPNPAPNSKGSSSTPDAKR